MLTFIIALALMLITQPLDARVIEYHVTPGETPNVQYGQPLDPYVLYNTSLLDMLGPYLSRRVLPGNEYHGLYRRTLRLDAASGGGCTAYLLGPRIGQGTAHCFTLDGENFYTDYTVYTVNGDRWELESIYISSTYVDDAHNIPTIDDFSLFTIRDKEGRSGCVTRRCIYGTAPSTPIRIGDSLAPDADWGNYIIPGTHNIPEIGTEIGYPGNLGNRVILHEQIAPITGEMRAKTALHGSDAGEGSSGSAWVINHGILNTGQSHETNMIAGTTTIVIKDKAGPDGRVFGVGIGVFTNTLDVLWNHVCERDERNCS